MTTKTMKSVLLGCVAAIALSACQGTEQTARQQITSDAMQGNIAKQAYKEQQDNAGPGNVRFRQEVWLGSEATRSSNGMPLPAAVETADAVQLASANPMSLIEIARRVTMITGIEVVGANQLGLNRPGASDLSDANEDPRNIQAVIDYTGPLSGLLDMVASKFGVSWEYRGGVVRVFDFDTRSFTLVAAPTTTEMENEIQSTINAGGNSSGGDTASGTESQSGSTGGVTTQAKLDYWKRVEADVEKLLPNGTNWSVSPEAGAITVTARPQILERVAKYVKDQNARMTRQVAISVKVLAITKQESEGIETSLDTVFEDAGIAFNSLAPGIGTVNTAINSLTLGKTKFAGTEMLVSALSTRQDVSVVTSGSATTMNNQPAPIQVSTETAYISGYESSSTDSSTIVTPKTDSVTTGFSMAVLPRILPNNTVALNYSLGISSLDDVEEFGDDFPVEKPVVSSRGFQQNVMLRSGDTLILGGFERMKNNVENNKDDLLSWALGGDRKAEAEHELLIVLITPVIIENPADLARMQ